MDCNSPKKITPWSMVLKMYAVVLKSKNLNIIRKYNFSQNILFWHNICKWYEIKKLIFVEKDLRLKRSPYFV